MRGKRANAILSKSCARNCRASWRRAGAAPTCQRRPLHLTPVLGAQYRASLSAARAETLADAVRLLPELFQVTGEGVYVNLALKAPLNRECLSAPQ